MIDKIDAEKWDAFRKSGLLWWVNRQLHLFNYALTYHIDSLSGEIINVVPEQVNYTGFSEDSESRGFERLRSYMQGLTDEQFVFYGVVDDYGDNWENGGIVYSSNELQDCYEWAENNNYHSASIIQFNYIESLDINLRIKKVN